MRIDQETRQRFEDCIDSCAEALFRVAYRLTGDHNLATELVQETYLNAWQNMGSLRQQEKMRSWMFAILRNQYSKLVRRERKNVASNAVQDVAGIESEANETIDIVQAAVNQLDDEHRMPLLLVAMERLSVDETSTMLSIPRGTVLSRLHRGRQKLKQILLRSGVNFARSDESNG